MEGELVLVFVEIYKGEFMKILVGPLLGIESNKTYTVCFLSSKSNSKPVLRVNDTSQHSFEKAGETPNGMFWRAEFEVDVPDKENKKHYEILTNGKNLSGKENKERWDFYIPAKDSEPNIAYASCNGFSSKKLLRKENDPYHLWNRMKSKHEEQSYALLIMGGDQLYADSIWESKHVPIIEAWVELPDDEQIEKSADKELETQLDNFYEDLYIKAWSNPAMSYILASVPSIMMWDDHDIFDGWGSHPEKIQSCDVYQCIFKVARKYFEMFQIRTLENHSLINKNRKHYSFGFNFRKYNILALDNRTERTRKTVMSECHWQDVESWIKTKTDSNSEKRFFLLSGIPVAYRSFSKVEAFLEATPWIEELEDDVLDHWSSKGHQRESLRLVNNLLNISAQKYVETVAILSGDVHIGCLGVIRKGNHEVLQIVSSGIVHPAPTKWEWLAIKVATNDDPQKWGKGEITAELIEPYESDRYIRSRNFLSIGPRSSGSLRLDWICERDMNPNFDI